MKTIVALIAMLITSLEISARPDTYPSSTSDLVEGLKLALASFDHECSNGDCEHFSLEDSNKATLSAGFMKGYIAAIRVSQAVGNAAVVMNFPEEGVDYIRLIEPYVEFIESNEKLVEEHASLSMYIFLAKRFPVEKQDEPNQAGDDNSE